MVKNKHFRRGQSTYICAECGKRTRDTQGEGNLELCLLCMTKGEALNVLVDHGYNGDDPYVGCQTCEEVFVVQTEIMREMGHE